MVAGSEWLVRPRGACSGGVGVANGLASRRGLHATAHARAVNLKGQFRANPPVVFIVSAGLGSLSHGFATGFLTVGTMKSGVDSCLFIFFCLWGVFMSTYDRLASIPTRASLLLGLSK